MNMRVLWILVYILLVQLIQVESKSLSVVITAEPSNGQSISLSLFSLESALQNHYRSQDVPVQAEIIIAPLELPWEDRDIDTIQNAMKLSSIEFSPVISRVLLLDTYLTDSSYSNVINNAVRHATGDLILFLSHNTYVHPEFLEPMMKHLDVPNVDEIQNQINSYNQCLNLSDDESDCNLNIQNGNELGVGIVAGKQITHQGNIFDAGVDFKLFKIPEKDKTNETYTLKGDSEDGKIRKNILYSKSSDYPVNDNEDDPLRDYGALPILRWKGESQFYQPATERQFIQAASGLFMMMHKSLFTFFGGLDSSYSSRVHYKHINYPFIDFQQVLRLAGYKILFQPNSIATCNLDLKEHETHPDKVLLTTRWGNYLDSLAKKHFLFEDSHVHYRMECGTTGVLGFTVEALNLLNGLQNYVPLSIAVSDVKRCIKQLGEIGLQDHKLEMLQRLHDNIPDNGDSIVIIHKDPGRYQAETGRIKLNSFYTIGRSMYETDNIPDRWKLPINKFTDELWVPSQFNVDSFSSDKVDKDMIFVFGEGVDVNTFDPNIPSTSLRFTGELCNPHEIEEGEEKIEIEDTKRFTFLCVAKHEVRKGWKELISSFIQEFREDDPVRLVFRTSILHYEEKDFIAHITELENEFGKSAPIYVIKHSVSFQKLPDLYKTANALVSASHGEGWGLPLMEGMAMGLPVIAVNWGGNVDFMKDDNSLLVAVEEMTSEGTSYASHNWAKLDLIDLRRKMRRVFEDSEFCKEIGKNARNHIIENWTIEKVAYQFAERLRIISEDKEFYKKQSIKREALHATGKTTFKSKKPTDPEQIIKDGRTFYKMNILS